MAMSRRVSAFEAELFVREICELGSLSFGERFKRKVCGALAHGNHSIDGRGPGNVTVSRNFGMNVNVCVRQRESIMRRINVSYPRWRTTQRTHQRTPFPYIGGNNDLGVQLAADMSWQHTGEAAVFEL